MATKEEIVKDVLASYSKHAHLFDKAGVSDLKFYKWLHSQKSHADLRKANSFFYSGLKKKQAIMFYVGFAGSIWGRLPESDWAILLKTARNDPDVMELRAALNDIKLAWGQRPKKAKAM